MSDPSYIDYDPDAALNGEGQASQTRFPEGWPGRYANDALRWMGAALRRLGDQSLFAPGTIGAPASQTAGTLALQDAASISITGGTFTGYGYMPVLSVVPIYTTWTHFLEIYEVTMHPYGWLLCDGRSETAPAGYVFTTPNLLGRYVMFLDDTALVGTGGGSFGSTGKTTTSDGLHNHGNSTGSTALSEAQIPSHTHTYSRTTGSGGTEGSGPLASTTATTTTTGATGGSQGHTHTIGTDGVHTHTIADIRPLSVMTIPIIRAW